MDNKNIVLWCSQVEIPVGAGEEDLVMLNASVVVKYIITQYTMCHVCQKGKQYIASMRRCFECWRRQ